jgi:hypothetical protein
MTRRLGKTVHVERPGSGERHVFRAGAVPPEWAQEAITNPKAWADTDDDDADHAEVDADPGGAEVKDADPGGADPRAGGGDPVRQPPRVGKGSGRDEWVVYGKYRGLTVGDQMSRDAIIAAVDDLDRLDI